MQYRKVFVESKYHAEEALQLFDILRGWATFNFGGVNPLLFLRKVARYDTSRLIISIYQSP
jgi:hypothetical protein